jgi:hypothetical protein
MFRFDDNTLGSRIFCFGEGMQGSRNCRALYLSNAELVKILLQYEADVNVVDGREHTPLDIALEVLELSCPSIEEIGRVHDRISALLDHGGAITKHGERPLKLYCDWLKRRFTYHTSEASSGSWSKRDALKAPSLLRLEQVPRLTFSIAKTVSFS